MQVIQDFGLKIGDQRLVAEERVFLEEANLETRVASRVGLYRSNRERLLQSQYAPPASTDLFVRPIVAEILD